MQYLKTFDTVRLNENGDAVVIIDQTYLPVEQVFLELSEVDEMFEAIQKLRVRGAPAIGVFAALGIYVLARNIESDNAETFTREFRKKKDYLNSARPTAVNLSWALNRMEKTLSSVTAGGSAWRDTVLAALQAEAKAIYEEDIETCRKIGENGLIMLHPNDGVLTHCNAGRLATVRYGTATAPIYLAEEKGYHLRVYCDETRPLLQGARLTAFELQSAGIDTTLLCDNMVSSLMKTGKINAVFVGADRVAANGDAANKIGTSVVAMVAKHYDIPFYVCAPCSTIDKQTPTGDEITIEERAPEEVTEMWYEKRMAPEGVKVYNPAFDVTPNELITGIITEKGVLKAPYDKAIANL